MAARVGHSRGAPIYGDPASARKWLEGARRTGNKRGVVYGRQSLTVSAACQRRAPSHPDCAACHQRAERVRGLREEFLAEIAQLPGSVPAYRASRRLDFRAAAEGDYWLLKELEPLLDVLEGEGRAGHERRLRVLEGGRA
jgi:hypothetical protein